MHYIRLLRPPTIKHVPKDGFSIQLLLTITTDLGDTFLHPQEAIDLDFKLADDLHASKTTQLKPQDPKSASWKPGLRVLKTELRTKTDNGGKDFGYLTIAASPVPSRHISLDSSAQLLPWHQDAKFSESEGFIAPLTVRLGMSNEVSDVAIRNILLPASPEAQIRILIEEDMGESIARHIWDAGLVTAAFFADATWNPKNPLGLQEKLLSFEEKERTTNILELGCGVGVLGISLAAMPPPTATSSIENKPPASYILMTDLPEAEERATSNIFRFQDTGDNESPKQQLEYENLDWEEGSQGRFGDKVDARYWDYIILSDCTYNVDVFPLLVATLSAVHTHNCEIMDPSQAPHGDMTTKVLLSTKPRHDSERALFELLNKEGWEYRLETTIPMLKINEQDEVVEIYSFTKTTLRSSTNDLKRKGSQSDDLPSKRTALEEQT